MCSCPDSILDVQGRGTAHKLRHVVPLDDHNSSVELAERAVSVEQEVLVEQEALVEQVGQVVLVEQAL